MNHNFNTVTVIGLGYVGLPTATIIASNNINVNGLDNNRTIVNTVNQGLCHIREPNLNELVKSAVDSGYLRASTIIQESDVFIVAVPTPLNNNKNADLSYIKAAIKTIASVVKKNDLIIIESTVPIGTTEKVLIWLSEYRFDLIFPCAKCEKQDVYVSYCPERVLPGNALEEIISNDRIIGGSSATCAKIAQDFYQLFAKGRCIITTAKTAEISKLAENAYRDINIAYANELSMLCDNNEIDSWEVIKLANHHPRVNILNPGPGVGGHCIAVDPLFLVESHPELTPLIQTARKVNDTKADYILKKILAAIVHVENPIIACFGISYKENISDLRESPGIKIITKLAESISSPILVVDPNISTLPSSLKKLKIIEKTTIKDAISDANIFVIFVAHKEFKIINWKEIREHKVVIDTQGLTNNVKQHKKGHQILLFADRLPPKIGGMEMHAHYFINHFSSNDSFQLIGTITKSDDDEDLLLVSDQKIPISLPELAQKTNPNIIFFNSGKWIEELEDIRLLFPNATFIYRTGGNEILKAPLVKYHKDNHKTRQAIWATIINSSIDLMITNSVFTEKRLNNLGIKCELSRVVGGVNTDAIAKSKTQSSDTLKLFCAARFVPYKNHKLLITVISQLTKRGYNLFLTLAGDGPLLEDTQSHVKNLGLESAVSFLGPVDNESVCEEIRRSDVYIQLSGDHITHVKGGKYLHTEGMGRSVLEAISAGTFVIAGKSGALPEIITKSNGLLVELNNLDDITNSIDKTLNNLPTSLPSTDKYSWEHVFSQYESIMSELLHHEYLTCY